jgi:hypothetical protein
MHDKVTVRTQMCVPIFSHWDNVKLQNDSVTLTFEVGMWFLDATHRLDVVDRLFLNPSMYDKVKVRTWIKWGRTDGQMMRLYYASFRYNCTFFLSKWNHQNIVNLLNKVYEPHRDFFLHFLDVTVKVLNHERICPSSFKT